MLEYGTETKQTFLPPRPPLVTLTLVWWIVGLYAALPTIWLLKTSWGDDPIYVASVLAFYIFGIAYAVVLILNFHSPWFWALSLVYNVADVFYVGEVGMLLHVVGAFASGLYLYACLREFGSE